MRFLLLLVFLAGCELLAPPAAPIDGGSGRGRGDECEDDEDCDGGEFCDDGDCAPISEGEGEGEEGEGEGEGEEGEGEPPPPPPPDCADSDCPQILDFGANITTLDQFQAATLSAIVTDPDGPDDILGGVLIDPTSESTYATFIATGPGSFQLDVGWSELGSVRPIDFATSTTRVVRARFFDAAGHEVFADLTLTLVCDGGGPACDGECGAERCQGVCQTPEDFSSTDNCGTCGNVCDPGAVCDVGASGGFECICQSADCRPTVPGEPYSGTPEDGVKCGQELCSGSFCCFDIFGGPPTCGASCPFGGGAECDGPEDCGLGQECCFEGFGTACRDTGDCRANSGREVCVDVNDCEGGELCCSSSIVQSFGGDGGVCAVEDPDTGGCPDL